MVCDIACAAPRWPSTALLEHMPTYAYHCPACGHEFEKFQKMTATTRAKCPKCGKAARRQITGGAGLLFKGSGFYITDYPKGGAPDKGEKGDKSEKSDKGEGAKGGKADEKGPKVDQKAKESPSPKSGDPT